MTTNNNYLEEISNSSSIGKTTPRRLSVASPENPLLLECGQPLEEVVLEYEVYGEMNSEKSNVILVAHALSGDAHAAGWDTTATEREWEFRVRKPGWWDGIIGPGKCLDTSRYCIICCNVIGSCYGSTGPLSEDPATGLPYGKHFPMVTVGDWVKAQARLMDKLGVERLHLVIGGSLGGQQALEWAIAYPERVENAAILASAATLCPMMIGINHIARAAILSDPHFYEGDYHAHGVRPDNGLSTARMMGHLTFLSHQSMGKKFARERRSGGTSPEFTNAIEFQVESYLSYQAKNFCDRFDANSYLLISKAMDYYDAANAWGNGDLATACQRIKANCLVLAFEGDWMYTPEESKDLADAMTIAGVNNTFVNAPSGYGHDAFLVDLDTVTEVVRKFLG